MLRSLIFFCALLLLPVANAKDLSLDEIRTQLLLQEVVVLGNSFGGYGPMSESLVDWYFVKGDETNDFIRVSSAYSHVSASLRGKRGLVISVEEATTFLSAKKAGNKDAFGMLIDNSSVMNPYVQVVVKLAEDDALIGTTNYYGNMIGQSIQLVSRAGALKMEIEENLARLIGKKLYKTGYTKLLDSTLSLKELLERNKRELSRDYETKNLTPLNVVDTKFLEAENAVVVKVELPNGQIRLLFGYLNNYDRTYAYKPTLLERMNITAEENIPAKFSSRELSAIREGKVFRGMSEDALYWSWGYAEKTNDWGLGGKQHIYHGSQYVYVEGRAVRDWQSIR